MEQLSPSHKRSLSDNLLHASSEYMEMEPFSPNQKRVLTRSDTLLPRMEMGDSSNIGYGQFSEEVVDTSQIKSDSQEISSQTGLGAPGYPSYETPQMDRYLSDDLENNKDLLERSYPKDGFQETEFPTFDYPIGENISDIHGPTTDLPPDLDLPEWENSSVRRRPISENDYEPRPRSVSPPRRRRFQSAPSNGSVHYENNSLVASQDGIGFQSLGSAKWQDYSYGTNSNPAADSAQLDELNYTRASNVTVSNFVSVKLSGKSNYPMWRAQMECLMKSYKMRGLVIKDKELPVNKNIELRERYEVLLNGWLIGSLSEEIIKDTRIYNKGAKGIWDTLEQSYDPYAISPTDSTLLLPRDKKEKQGTDIDPRLIQKLQNATLEGHWWKAKSILNDHKGAATWEINVNYDTLFHIAVRLGNNYFLEKLLDVIHTGTEIETRNSKGHTALHIAAIVGNKEAAELLVGKRKELLLIKDNDSKIPLACAYTKNVYVYLERFTEDKRKEKENEKEKEKGIEEGKEKENEKEKGKEGKENEKDKRKEKEKRKEERKQNEMRKRKGKGKGIKNKNEKVKEKKQDQEQEQEGEKIRQSRLFSERISQKLLFTTNNTIWQRSWSTQILFWLRFLLHFWFLPETSQVRLASRKH